MQSDFTRVLFRSISLCVCVSISVCMCVCVCGGGVSVCGVRMLTKKMCEDGLNQPIFNFGYMAEDSF